MATTEPDTSPRWSFRRYLYVTAATASALVLAIGALAVARGGDDTPPPASFWSSITPVVSEEHPPQTLDQITAGSDAVVVAHISGIRDGRDMKGVFDPTPPVPGAPLPHSSFVELTVDRVVSGQVSNGQRLTLEMVAPPTPTTLDDVRALIPDGEELFFLRNSGTRARAAGFGSVMDPVEDSIWGLSSMKGVLAQGPYGLYEMLKPNESDVPFLESFGASTVDEAATHVLESLH
jgi:hypothetical protein